MTRAHLQQGRLDGTAAAQIIDDLADWPGERYSHHRLLRRAFQLRDDVRVPDAMYVALAEALGVALLTLDSRLAAATGPRCQIEVFE